MLRVLGPLAQCNILSALNIFNARRYALTNGIYYGPVSVRLVVTSRCPAYNSRLQSHARIYAHSQWRCLNVLPCALQKWMNRSTAKPQTDADTR